VFTAKSFNFIEKLVKFADKYLLPKYKQKLLKTSVLYGANGSGKSNLLTAIRFFKSFILSSSNEKQATDEIKVIRFLLSSETDNEPSHFEMIFYVDDIRYRYGFETDKEKVHSEWLFSFKNEPSSKETKLFTREYKIIKIKIYYVKLTSMYLIQKELRSRNCFTTINLNT